MKTIFLSRKEHDAMLDQSPSVLRALFAAGTAKWSLAGVSFIVEHIEVSA